MIIENDIYPGYIQITRRCNNNCIFCSNPKFEKDLDVDEIKDIIYNYKKSGKINQIIITGGEPTLHKNLTEVILFANSLGFDTKMMTNAILLSDNEFVKKIKDAKLHHINISIHTHRREDYKTLSNTDNILQVLKGIHNCILNDFEVNFNITLNSINKDYLSKLIGFLIQNFPSVNHYVFNNLDIGFSDKKHQSMAGVNFSIIAKLSEIELELNKSLELLEQNNKTFRVERVPLCYMGRFKDCSTETRRIVKEQDYRCTFIQDKGKENILDLKINSFLSERKYKNNNCQKCSLYDICSGIDIDYYNKFGDFELSPVFEDKLKIIEKILK